MRMRLTDILRLRLRSLFLRRKVEQELDEEVCYHLERLDRGKHLCRADSHCSPFMCFG